MEAQPGLVTKEYLDTIVLDGDKSLLAISNDQPVLLVFLRHFGCIFCRQALKDINSKREFFEKHNTEIIFVHMSDMDKANKYFEEFGFTDVKSISDPETKIYGAFGLVKGSFSQLYGLSVWAKGVKAIASEGLSFSTQQIGDSFQMPGIFVIYQGGFEYSYYHRKISDKPNYDKIVNCCEV